MDFEGDVALEEDYGEAHLKDNLVELVVKGRNDEVPGDPESQIKFMRTPL